MRGGSCLPENGEPGTDMRQADSLPLRCHKKGCVSNDLLLFKGGSWANVKYSGVRVPRLTILVRRSERQLGVPEDQSVVQQFPIIRLIGS